MRALLWVVALVLGLTSAAEAKKKLAVLEFSNGAGLKPKEVSYMVDVVRGEAVKLPQSKFLIMTKENILEMLPPGVDLASCEGDCEVETGRNIGADYLIIGEFLELGGDIKISMRLYDTNSGGLMASEKGTAGNVKALEGVVQAAAGRLMKPIGHPGRQRAARTFGADLPVLEQIEDGPLVTGSAPQLGSLADLDVGMLEKYEAATKVERSKKKSVCEKAAAWQDLVDHSGVSDEIEAEAERRARHWKGVAKSIARRCAQIQSVTSRYNADKQKLARLMKLGNSTLSQAKKAELRAEFKESYGPWEKAINQYNVDCKNLEALNNECEGFGRTTFSGKRVGYGTRYTPPSGRPSWEIGLSRSQYKLVTDDNLNGRTLATHGIRAFWHWGHFTLGHSFIYALGMDGWSPVSPFDMQIDVGWSLFSWPEYDGESLSLLNPALGLHGGGSVYFAESHPDGGVFFALGGYYVRNSTYIDWLALTVEYRGELVSVNTSDAWTFTVGFAFPD